MSEDQIRRYDAEISAASRVEAFLADEAVAGAFTTLSQRLHAEFIAADDSEKRTTAWAKARALDELKTELRAIVGRGTQAQHDRTIATRNSGTRRGTRG